MRYATQFRYILVDEYQDTNRPQYLLVRQLASVHGNLAVVGDPDQSIYKWRGADQEHPRLRAATFPKSLIVRLEQNYRSTQVILDAASAVIRQNRQRKDKKLWTDRSGGEKIVYAARRTSSRKRTSSLRTIRDQLADDTEEHHRGPLPHERPVARDRRRADPRRACRTGWSAACGSTSARKSRTRSPT